MSRVVVIAIMNDDDVSQKKNVEEILKNRETDWKVLILLILFFIFMTLLFRHEWKLFYAVELSLKDSREERSEENFVIYSLYKCIKMENLWKKIFFR